MPCVLFIVKRRSSYGISFGLLNSSEFNSKALLEMGYESKVVQVIDTSDIEREVYKYNPTHILIEDLWVAPEKIKILANLYKNVNWYICIPSKTTFLANEGISCPWIKELTEFGKIYPNIFLACNNENFNKDLSRISDAATYCIPNMYLKPGGRHSESNKGFSGIVKVGCFGSLFPMKNQLEQAIAAIIFGQRIGKEIEFHINSVQEQKDDNVLKNLRAIIELSENKLVEHPWVPHKDFLDIVKEMDIGLQVSLSESFNLVTADFVHCGIPIVVSEDVEWMPWYTRCRPTDTEEIVHAMKISYQIPFLSFFNKKALAKHEKYARKMWKKFLEPIDKEETLW